MQIQSLVWVNEGEKTNEELDRLGYPRFNIKNFDDSVNHSLNNYYVFKIIDSDSSTGFSGMCIGKAYAEKVKQELEKWKAKKN